MPLLLTMTFLISWFILYNEIAFYSTRIFRFRYLALSPLSPNGSAASATLDAVQTVQRALTWQYSMHHFCYELKCTNFAKMQWDCNRDLRSFVQHCSGWVSGPSARCTVWCWCRSSASCASSTLPGLPSVWCTVLYCTALYCIVLYCTVLHCTVLYCTVLHCTVLYCIYYTIL